jgi:IclR family acetate operon transcriptional repressor
MKIEGLPAKTRKSITKIKTYRTDLATIRKRGYATDFGEYDESIVGVSAPVFDSSGQVVGAFSVAGPVFRMTKQKVGRYGRRCAEITAQLSAKLH